jgi:hypothetical protein
MIDWKQIAIDLKQDHSWKEIARILQNEYNLFTEYTNESNLIDMIKHGVNRAIKDGKLHTETCENHVIGKQLNQTIENDVVETLNDVIAKSPNETEPNYRNPVIANSATTEIKADGTIISERLIQIIEADSKNPKSVMLAHGFQPDEWELVSCRNNLWSMNSADESKVNCQSKITVKPIVKPDVVFDIESYFENKTFVNEKPLTNPIEYDEDDDREWESVEIDLPDLHGGLFSWRSETGEDYDLHIAKQRFETAMKDIENRCRSRKIEQITFVTLGDLLHFDNEEQSTTKGTKQQSDGRIAKVHDLILDMLIDAITMLGNIAPVLVIYLPGNHDLITGRMLMKAVEKAFRNDVNVKFDLSPNPFKAIRIGSSLIGWTHGDMPEKNMSTWLPQMFRKEYGECSTVEVHAGHFHRQNTKEKSITIKNYNQTFEDGGVVVRYLPSISSASGWAHKQGFPKTVKTIMSFVWSSEKGLRDIWFSGVE